MRLGGSRETVRGLADRARMRALTFIPRVHGKLFKDFKQRPGVIRF